MMTKTTAPTGSNVNDITFFDPILKITSRSQNAQLSFCKVKLHFCLRTFEKPRRYFFDHFHFDM